MDPGICCFKAPPPSSDSAVQAVERNQNCLDGSRSFNRMDWKVWLEGFFIQHRKKLMQRKGSGEGGRGVMSELGFIYRQASSKS